ncbi:alpha-1,2-fucosyltransferase [Mucilaginibacter sp.]|uniref:alpha-1,2-fucosyltransferase n=1 Tax=Mucilaginibacter sp. TaxID=1882438 RepID=UPI0025E2AF9E|nr:alpha-1,2-fucosyltransferase [Mucilaginibacter sp.]
MIKLQGGLGNQMFQYAFGLSVAKKMNAQLYLDLSFYNQNHGLTPRSYALEVFGGQTKIAERKIVDSFFRPGLLQRVLKKAGLDRHTLYREKTMRFDKSVFDITPPVYFEGFWQSEQYFNSIENEIRSAFAFKKPLNTQSQKIAGEIAQQQHPVSIHVRRGDYVTSASTNELHGICSIAYYQKAIALIKQKVTNPTFYFFSDDAEWVAKNLIATDDNAVLVQHNEGDDSWQDMALMSKCRHHIIANSSFSWWAAWLNPGSEKMVIAPANWFAAKVSNLDTLDLIPKNWIQLPND